MLIEAQTNIRSITKKGRVDVVDCVGLGFSNIGKTSVFINNTELKPGRNLPIDLGIGIIKFQSFDIEFGSGSDPRLVVVVTSKTNC